MSRSGFDVLAAMLSPMSQRPTAAAAMQMEWFRTAEQIPSHDVQESPMLRCVEFPDATMVDHEMKMSMETEDTTAVPPSSSEHAFFTSVSSSTQGFRSHDKLKHLLVEAVFRYGGVSQLW